MKKKISDIGELKLIKKIRSINLSGKKALIGIGDDAAVVSWKNGKLLVLTTDSFVENVHFSLSWASFQDVGYKALAATLSDLAAMAAEPIGFLVSLGLPAGYLVKSVEELYDGFFELASDFKVELMGGDLVSSQVFFISLTAFGSVEENYLRTRSEAKPGEVLVVTGNLGYSALGLEILKKGLKTPTEKLEFLSPYLNAHLKPYPRIKEARFFSKMGARAMEDISDGLASEVMHIAEESEVGIEIYSDKLPLEKDFVRVAHEIGENPLDLILFGGEDYELVFTVSEEKKLLLFAEAKKMGLKLTEVGRVVEEKGAWLVVDGEKKPLKPAYEHFKSED